VVLVIRSFQPDVIITRFPPNERAGHGHHTASALLAEEAFEVAADAERYKEQLTTYQLQPWQTKRLYFNGSTWWDENLDEIAQSSKDYHRIDIGTYNPLLGLGYGEMAAESRSMHKSQGFGAARQRGTQMEYLQFKLGTHPENDDVFNGIPTQWKDLGKEGEHIQLLLEKAYNSYLPEQPEAIVPTLLEARKSMKRLKNNRVAQKIADLDELLLTLAGVYVEATTPHAIVVPDETVEMQYTIINRSKLALKLTQYGLDGYFKEPASTALNNNEAVIINRGVTMTSSTNQFSNPYWLNAPFEGVFEVQNPLHISKPEVPNFLATFVFDLNGTSIQKQVPVRYQWVDREKGELHRPLALLPEVTINFSDPVYVFSGENHKPIEVVLTAHAEGVSGQLVLQAPEGWQIKPEKIDFTTEKRGEETAFQFEVLPPETAADDRIKVIATVNNTSYNQRLTTIAYDHITTQTLLAPSVSRLIHLDIEKEGQSVAYVMGAGDAIPECLRQLGYAVEMIPSTELATANLDPFQAVVFGIRAYNTNKELAFAKDNIMNYMKRGGNVIVQYNTSRGIDENNFAPYPLQLSRKRVTKEDAPVKFLDATHPLLNQPNQLSVGDFEGWVQERGLYFADEWDDRYLPLFSWHDPGEEPQLGGLLLAHVGKGAFIYTGISFFRQLPAGVPGAYRLFTNLISYSGNHAK
jgi:hypothetical protein